MSQIAWTKPGALNRACPKSIGPGIRWRIGLLKMQLTVDTFRASSRLNYNTKRVCKASVPDMFITMLIMFRDCLQQLGIPYFLDFGTLLGQMRSADLIPWDTDVDVAVPLSFIDDRQVERFNRQAEKMGLPIRAGMAFHCEYNIVRVILPYHHSVPSQVRCTTCARVAANTNHSSSDSLYKDCLPNHQGKHAWGWDRPWKSHLFIDVLGTYVEEATVNVSAVRHGPETFPVNWIFPLKPCRLSNSEFTCPSNAAQVLTRLYGPDWGIPLKGGKPVFAHVSAGQQKLPAVNVSPSTFGEGQQFAVGISRSGWWRIRPYLVWVHAMALASYMVFKCIIIVRDVSTRHTPSAGVGQSVGDMAELCRNVVGLGARVRYATRWHATDS